MGLIIVPTMSVEVQWKEDRRGFLFIFEGEGRPGVVKELPVLDANRKMYDYIFDLVAEEWNGIDDVEMKGLKTSVKSQLENLLTIAQFPEDVVEAVCLMCEVRSLADRMPG